MARPKIQICMGSSCFARGNADNVVAVEKFLQAAGLRDEVDVELEGCLCCSRCSDGPIVLIDGVVHTGVADGVMVELLKELFPASGGGNTTSRGV